MRGSAGIVLLAVASTVVGCAEPSGTVVDLEPATERTAPAAAATRPPLDELPVPEAPDLVTPDGATTAPPGSTAEAAVVDLAGSLGVPPDQVAVVRTERVTWSDGSLGCPEPGSSYTQVLTDGMRIELEVDGTTYWYHSGAGRPPFLCEDARAPRGVDDT